MSRRWKYARMPMQCGGHDTEHPRLIAKGELYLEITIPEVKRVRIRCLDCAGYPPSANPKPPQGDGDA